jgi:deoxyribodipyrimidine photo-lyase
MQVVWFKRDLRIYDNAVLKKASEQGPYLPLYIFEPMLWKQPDMSLRHYDFLKESLEDLQSSLKSIGQTLIIKVGEAEEVFAKLHSTHAIKSLWSHQETWNDWTYQRDLRVKAWTHKNNISWNEETQNGVIRGLKNRDGWNKKWFVKMKAPIHSIPNERSRVIEASETLPKPCRLSLKKEHITHQRGGRAEGLTLLHSFLYKRGENYTKEMSSPVTATQSCSRLSPHIAFGTLSIKEIFHAYEKRKDEIYAKPPKERGQWLQALRSFSGRLYWHCHFIQKIEDMPSLEFKHMHPAYDGLRDTQPNSEFLEAWKTGNTGFPMIDACMRSLIATGWINFRMRAMLMSFASYHLWLDWRVTAPILAQQFTDYEPGIHYSQSQMQSGTTGMNAIRIYNPIKQSMDQDPDGIFIKQWVPELANVDTSIIHTPWVDESNKSLYPRPIVDEKKARKEAADTLYSLRKKDPNHRKISLEIAEKHGSRKRQKTRKKETKKTKQQLELPL